MSQRDNPQVESIAIYNQEGVVKAESNRSCSSGWTHLFATIATTAPHHHGKSRGQRQKSCCLHGLSECEAAGEHVVHYSWGLSYSLDVPQSNLVPLVWTVAMNIYNRCSVFKHASEYNASSKCQVNSTDSNSELGHGSLFFSFFLPNCHCTLFFWSLFQLMLMARCFVPNNKNGQNRRQAQWLWY